MARRRKARRKTRTVTKYIRGGGKGGFGNLKPVVDGLLAGGLGQFASKYIGEYGHPAATLGIGFLRNNTTFKAEGARELGALLAMKLPFIGGGTSISGRNY